MFLGVYLTQAYLFMFLATLHVVFVLALKAKQIFGQLKSIEKLPEVTMVMH